MNILDHYKQSHDLRTSQDYEVSINDQGAGLGEPAPVEGRFFYPEGDAPRPQYEGDMLERTGQALEDVGQTAKSMAVGAGAGMAGLPGDVVALTGGLARLLFPGDEGRIQGATDTITKISEAIGSERFLGLYRDLVNESDMSAEDKQMALDAAETGSFFSLPGAVPVAQAAKRGAKAYAAGAPARVAERQSGTTLASGVDPTAMIDDAIVSVGGRAVRPAKTLDEAKAAFDASPTDPVLRKQYLDLRRARDAELSQMPASKQLELDTSYRMQHQPRGPQDGGGRLDDITAGGELFPEDVYSADGLRFYGDPRNSFDRQSHAAILAARGNPEAEITIYRGVPKDVDQINAGDWVTLSPDYAAMHAADGYGPNGDEAGKVISMKVKVKDVFSDGNDLNEFGYFPEDLAELGVKKVVPPKETEPGIIAFHGSGADFDEFRLEMIGTGEGAQAYGYGLYFTDSEDIAKFYRDGVLFNQTMRGKLEMKYKGKPFKDLGDTAAAEAAPPSYSALKQLKDEMSRLTGSFSPSTKVSPDAPAAAAKKRLLAKLDADIEKYSEAGQADADVGRIELQGGGTLEELLLEDLQQQKQALLDIDPKDIEIATGKIYKVGLAPKPDELVDYDLSLNKQSEKIKKVLQPFYEKYGVANTADFGTLLSSVQSSRTIPDDAFAEKLVEAGIPGIKYRAAGSRGANVDAADAEMNYVIFDDKAVKILEKYGIVGPVAVTAGAASQADTEADDGKTT